MLKLTLRCVGSLWKARGCTTWIVRSKLSSDAWDARISHQNEWSPKAIENGSVEDALQLLEDCMDKKVRLPYPSYASLIHVFMQHAQHSAVDQLYSHLLETSDFIGAGIKTTLIKSYCDRRQFDRAIEMLRSFTKDEIVHHTRHYNYIIKSLAESGNTELALQLFEEKCEKQVLCSQSKSDKALTGNKDMLVALINPRNTSFAVQSSKDSPLKLNKLDSSSDAHQHSKSTARHRDKHTKTIVHGKDVSLYKKISLAVFNYLQLIAIKLPQSLLQVIRLWFDHDSVNQWNWTKSRVNEIGMCSNCGNQLTYGLRPSDLHKLESEILKLVSNLQKNSPCFYGNHLDNRMKNELEKFLMLVKERGPFDVLIDGPNVGLYGQIPQENSLKAQRIITVARNFFDEGKKVLLIINQKTLAWDDAKHLPADMEGICSVFASRFQMDDLYLLYAAAFSGMQHVEVVTNDRLRDHRLLLPASMSWTFLRWTRLNCVPFKLNSKGKVVFCRKKFDPVVQRAGNSWHFPATDGTWRCVTKPSAKD